MCRGNTCCGAAKVTEQFEDWMKMLSRLQLPCYRKCDRGLTSKHWDSLPTSWPLGRVHLDVFMEGAGAGEAPSPVTKAGTLDGCCAFRIRSDAFRLRSCSRLHLQLIWKDDAIEASPRVIWGGDPIEIYLRVWRRELQWPEEGMLWQLWSEPWFYSGDRSSVRCSEFRLFEVELAEDSWGCRYVFGECLWTSALNRRIECEGERVKLRRCVGSRKEVHASKLHLWSTWRSWQLMAVAIRAHCQLANARWRLL